MRKNSLLLSLKLENGHGSILLSHNCLTTVARSKISQKRVQVEVQISDLYKQNQALNQCAKDNSLSSGVSFLYMTSSA